MEETEALLAQVEALENEMIELRMLYVGCASREDREHYLSQLALDDRVLVEALESVEDEAVEEDMPPPPDTVSAQLRAENERERLEQRQRWAQHRYGSPPQEKQRRTWLFIALIAMVAVGYYVYRLPGTGDYAPVSVRVRGSQQDTIDELRDQVYFLNQKLQKCERGY